MFLNRNRDFETVHRQDVADSEWDQFLQTTPSGEFQQSGMWAGVKQVEGWRPSRHVFRENGAIVGGFQILSKKTRIGKIGYISRGPVVPEMSTLSNSLVLESIIRAIKIEKIKALIIQPPSTGGKEFPFIESGFIDNHLIKVVTSTIRVDVSDGVQGFNRQMNPNTRRIIRQAEKKGVTVREGKREDMGLFFRLMEATCRRQGTRPNPPTVRSFESIWLNFTPSGCCRLTIAEFEGKPISGLLCLPFGEVVHMWKKGSLPEYLHLHPVDLLYFDALRWAGQAGYRICDFEEMVDRSSAEKILKGDSIPVEEIHPRDRIHLRFGGKPYLLKESHLFVNNFLIRRFLSLSRDKATTRLLKKFTGIRN